MAKPTPAQFTAQVQWIRAVGIGARVMLLAPAVAAHPFHCNVLALSGDKHEQVTFGFDNSPNSPFPPGCQFRIIVEERRRHLTVVASGVVDSPPGTPAPAARTTSPPPRQTQRPPRRSLPS